MPLKHLAQVNERELDERTAPTYSFRYINIGTVGRGALVEEPRIVSETGYVASYFIQMVSELGGLKAPRQLIRAPAPSEGFTTLWEKKRLDLSVEYHVLLPQFEHLFDRREREIAYRRLQDYGLDVSVFDRMEDPV